MIINCTCKNSFQDERHGFGKRVGNPMKKTNAYRCTSCGKEVNVTAAKEEKKDKKGE
jgi:predicted SprT family Zn-dependent metalloprotease